MTTQEDVKSFLSELHVKVYEQMLQGEMDSHLGYKKGSKAGINTGDSYNGSCPKKTQGNQDESVIEVPRDRVVNLSLLLPLNIKAGTIY